MKTSRGSTPCGINTIPRRYFDRGWLVRIDDAAP
jgi:hypothetical protein